LLALTNADAAAAPMVVLFTADQVLVQGLAIVGFDEARQENVQRERIDRFWTFFGTVPILTLFVQKFGTICKQPHMRLLALTPQNDLSHL